MNANQTCTGGLVVSAFNTDSPSQFNFLIFCGVWTALLAVPYLTLAPRLYAPSAHKLAILAVEAITMIFWFAGFIAGAVYLDDLVFCDGSFCSSAKAGVVFAAFEW